MVRPAKLLGSGLALAIALALLGLRQDSVPAQDKKLPEKQKFNATTPDGVKLVGDFYPSPKGRNGPVIMLLHAVGRSDTKTTSAAKLPAGFHRGLAGKRIRGAYL
jgi:predicted acyl esterase